MRTAKTKPSAADAETIRINPKVSARQGIPNKTYQTFVSEMVEALIEGAKWIPLNFAADPEAAHRELERRRKREAEDRQNDDARNAAAFHSLPNSMKARMIKAGSPHLSDKEAAAKASLVVGTKKRHGISEEYNQGHKKERWIISAGKRHGLLSQGDLSGRGSDAVLHHPNGKNYNMGIKAEGAASGQIRLHYHPRKGWHFNPGKKPKPSKPMHQMSDAEKHAHKTAMGKWRMGKAIADHLHREGIHHQIGKHLGKPKDTSPEGASKHFSEVVKKKGEPKIHMDAQSKHRLVKAIRKGMNNDHAVHISGKGTFALHPKIAKETGLPYLGDHIPHEALPFALSYRGRNKIYKSGGPRRPTVQTNLDHEVIEPSHVNIEHTLKELDKKKKKNGKKKIMREEDEKRESTKSMIARLVAKRSRKLGQPVPKDVERDIEPNIHAADPKPTNEATSTNDPNRGRMGRKKPLVPHGMMPDDARNPRTGNPVRTLGKLHSRMGMLSPETRARYRQNYGYRTRVAGRKGRIYPPAV